MGLDAVIVMLRPSLRALLVSLDQPKLPANVLDPQLHRGDAVIARGLAQRRLRGRPADG